MKSHELFAELASHNRLAILKALEKETLKFTQVTKIIDATSPEASRQLNRLSGKELITKDGEGYYSLTYLGKLVVSSLSNLEAIAQRSDFSLSMMLLRYHNIFFGNWTHLPRQSTSKVCLCW